MALQAFGPVFAQRLGQAPPVVLALHGWGRRGRDFDLALAGLDALAVDLPGFGASPPPPGPVGAAWYAAALAEVVAAFPQPPLVVGHSFGGRVAVALAGTSPVRGLLLTGVPLVRLAPPKRPSLGFRFLRAAHAAGIVSDDRMEAIRRRRGSADYRAVTGVMRDVLVTVVAETYEADLGRIRAPVELLWGAEDREVPPAVAERALEVLVAGGAEARLEVVPGVGHLLPLEAPAILREAVERMLAG